MDSSRIKYLLEGWVAARLTPKELEEFTGFLADEHNRALFVEAGEKLFGEEKAATPAKIISLPRRHRWVAIRVAVCILLIGAGSFITWRFLSSPAKPVVADHRPAEIAPGKDGAILTLADGQRLVLDSVADGVVAVQNGSAVLRRSGELSYRNETGPDATAGTYPAPLTYNTITTPNGRQFRLVLPDGSRVWLNAASSIRYPIAFNGAERAVTLTGEAYFEIAPNSRQPFFVHFSLPDKKGNGAVEVLGTSFDIDAYGAEQAIRTTLIRGSVRVNGGPGSTAKLRPGDQASLFNGSRLDVRPVDTRPVVAWKEGFFNFEGLSLEETMRQLGRWYDIDVVYEKNIPGIRFFGSLSRTTSLSGVLSALERSGLRFTLEGRRLTILP